MAIFEIQVDSLAEHFDLQVVLDGVSLSLEFRWNARAEAWYLDILTAEGDLIAAGRKLVIDAPLMLRGWRDSDDRLPLGNLFVADTTSTGTRPGRYDLGDRVRLYYLDEEGVLEEIAEEAGE
jgi:hypothetical protein